MNTLRRMAVFLAVCSPLTTTVCAADTSERANSVYVFGTAGVSKVDWSMSKSQTPAGQKQKQDSSEYGWVAGVGYRIIPYLGVQIDHREQIAAATRDNVGNYRTDGNAISAVGFVPLGDRFELFGSIGATRQYNAFSSRSSGSLNSFYKTVKESRTAATYGLGVNYYLTNHWALRAEGDYMPTFSASAEKTTEAGRIQTALWTAGAVYTF